MAGAPVLELRGVVKAYGRQRAVDGIDLALRQGEFMTFLGPSGSGKTTTLMMVAGLQRPDGGSILLNGTAVDALPPYRRDIGMVFQHYALFPHMTVRRNVAFPLEARGVAKAEIGRQVDDVLRLVGLPGFGDRLPREMSGGQQQRVALARAMVYRPSLLLMDEPLGALDRKLRGQMQMEIVRVHRERRMSVLYVTHDQEEALTMSDRIAVFNAGRIEQTGTPADLYDRPQTRFVASFLGETNFLPGTVVSSGGGLCQVSVGGATFAAKSTHAVASGTDVEIAVRPERMTVLPQGEGAPAVMEGTVYLGSSRKLTLRLADGTPCTTTHQAGTMEHDAPHPGQTVGLGFQAAHATVFAKAIESV